MSQQESSEKKSEDASFVISRNLGSGYSCCESCIQRSARENVFVCVCKLTTILVNVKDLPLNRPILGSDSRSGKQSKRLTTSCVECGKEVEHKFFAVCKSEGCSKFQQLICLLCVHEKHKDHATSLFEEYIREEGEDCVLKLELQQDLISLFNEVQTNAGHNARREGLIEKNTFGDGFRGDAELHPGEERIGPVGEEDVLDHRTIQSGGIDNRVAGQKPSSGDSEVSPPLGEDNTVPAKGKKNVIVMDLSKEHTVRVVECAKVRAERGVYYKLRLELPSASHVIRLRPGQFLWNFPNFMCPNLSIEERGHVHLLASFAKVIGSQIEVRGYTTNFVYEGRGVARTRVSNSSEWEKRRFKRIVMVTDDTPWRALHVLSFMKGMTRKREDKTQLDIIIWTPSGKMHCIDEAAKKADHVRVIYLKTPVKSLSSDVPQLEKPDEDTAIVFDGVDATVFNQFNPNNVFDISAISPIQ